MARVLVLEGADCSGKTTLANNIVSFLGQDNVEYIHSTYQQDMDVFNHHRMNIIRAQEAMASGKSVVVLDRHWISECVYGSEYRSGCSYAPAEEKFHKRLQELDARYIMCVPDRDQQINQHYKRRKENGEMYSSITGVVDRYIDLLCGRHLHYLPQNLVDRWVMQGGVQNKEHFFHYDWTKHGDDYAELIREWCI